jgi:hypothetical protein
MNLYQISLNHYTLIPKDFQLYQATFQGVFLAYLLLVELPSKILWEKDSEEVIYTGLMETG